VFGGVKISGFNPKEKKKNFEKRKKNYADLELF